MKAGFPTPDAAEPALDAERPVPRISVIWPWLAAAASGGLLALCYPPFGQGWLVWVSLTPLIAAVWFGTAPKSLGPGVPSPFLLGYVAGIAFFTTVFGWLGTLAELFENPWLRAIPLVLALYMGLYFAFWAWFLGVVRGRDQEARKFSTSLGNLRIGALGACAWVAHEWVRGWLFSGFGWNTLGVALHRDLPMIQIADLTGVAGLSWLVAFCNLMAVIVVRRIVGEFGPVFLKRVRWEFSFTMALVVLVFSYGVRAMLRRDPAPPIPLNVAAIQSNIPQAEKMDIDQEQAIFAIFDQLTGLALLTQPPLHLVIWPESATPRGMFADRGTYEFVMKQMERGDFALLLGTDDFDPEIGEDYNAAALLTERGRTKQVYRKMHLVPFGEYLPLRPIFEPLLGQLVPGDFGAGKEPAVMTLKNPPLRLGTLICFEDTLADLARHSVSAGAQLLVNVTNDGWFGLSAAAEQHLANAIFRAVENRRPLVRGANTGVTCSVDAAGRVDRSGHGGLWIEPFSRGLVRRTLDVPSNPPVTFFTQHGDWISPISAVVVVIAAGAEIWRRRHRSDGKAGA